MVRIILPWGDQKGVNAKDDGRCDEDDIDENVDEDEDDEKWWEEMKLKR